MGPFGRVKEDKNLIPEEATLTPYCIALTLHLEI